MACETEFAVAPQVMSSLTGGGNWNDINIDSIGSKTALIQSLYPTYDCATLAGFVPSVFNQPLPGNNAIVRSGGKVNLSNVAASFVATGNDTFTDGVYRVSLFVTNIGGAQVAYGYWDITWAYSGGSTSTMVSTNITYPGADVIMGDDISGPSNVYFSGSVVSGFVPFSMAMTTALTDAVQSVTDAAGYLGCIIPACGVAPPSPPSPPNLPFMPPFPTINPGQNSPSPTFPPTRQASRFLAVLANYTVFSDFGSNYGYRIKK